MRIAFAVLLLAVLATMPVYAEEDHNQELAGRGLKLGGLSWGFSPDLTECVQWNQQPNGSVVLADTLILSSASGPNSLVYASKKNQPDGSYYDYWNFRWENGKWVVYLWMPPMAGFPGYWKKLGVAQVI